MSLLIVETYEVVRSERNKIVVTVNNHLLAKKKELDELIMNYRVDENALFAVHQNQDVIIFTNFPVHLVDQASKTTNIYIGAIDELGNVTVGIELKK